MSYALGKDMRRSSIATSAMLHVTVLILVTISFPWLKKEYEEPPPMQVELVTVSEMAQTTKAAPATPKVEKKVEEDKPEAKQEPKKPQPAPTHTLEHKEPIIKPPEKAEVKEEKPVEKVDEMAMPKKQPVKKVPDKKAVEKKDDPEAFKKLLINIQKVKPEETSHAEAPPKPDAHEKTGQPLPLGQRMTMLETDALRRQLEGCWNIPMGAKDAENLTVDIFMVINQDRTLQSAQVVDQARYNGDTFFRAMADSALRAVRNPNCSPFDVPPDKYESWKTVTVTFDPSEVF